MLLQRTTQSLHSWKHALGPPVPPQLTRQEWPLPHRRVHPTTLVRLPTWRLSLIMSRPVDPLVLAPIVTPRLSLVSELILPQSRVVTPKPLTAIYSRSSGSPQNPLLEALTSSWVEQLPPGTTVPCLCPSLTYPFDLPSRAPSLQRSCIVMYKMSPT